MYTVKYKKCIAQQHNKTFDVTVTKDENAKTYPCDKKLSMKEMRTMINKYISEFN